MSDRIVMLIIMRIKYRFLDYSLAPNANRAHCGYRNKENDMNKKLIKKLLEDDETRDQIANTFGKLVEEKIIWHFGPCDEDLMVEALDKLNDTPAKAKEGEADV